MTDNKQKTSLFDMFYLSRAGKQNIWQKHGENKKGCWMGLFSILDENYLILGTYILYL